MRKYKLLVLTDHALHRSYESLYPLLSEMAMHPLCERIDVASRGLPENDSFFHEHNSEEIFVHQLKEGFEFSNRRQFFGAKPERKRPGSYDWILLRIPRPNPEPLFKFIASVWGTEKVINNPLNIHELGSKAYLLNFKKLCPPMHLTYHLEEILKFRKKYPIVLKPLFQSGGRGIIKIAGNTVWEGNQSLSLEAYLPTLEQNSRNGYLIMKYLENVDEGDKRIIVVDGNIMGSVLRVPRDNSWLCNAHQGGISILSRVDQDELKIIEKIDPVMKKHGIIFYGIDTLMGDHGKRVLSEINASNAGGILPAEIVSGEAVISRTSKALWEYILSKEKIKLQILDANTL
ncbi:MAG: hypothetical protein R8P61_29250 [Bacteroidia bacterium]|nr:hypothetical protein [Bacteroidia bacterium]